VTVAALRAWHASDGRHGTRLYMWCPGCDDLHAVEVSAPNRWTWDGNLESPTVSPSILVEDVQWKPEYGFHKPTHHVAPGDPTRCHSFVKQGRWEFLDDCTHHLTGQTAPMVPLPAWLEREPA
jgi:hypothetical protein